MEVAAKMLACQMAESHGRSGGLRRLPLERVWDEFRFIYSVLLKPMNIDDLTAVYLKLRGAHRAVAPRNAMKCLGTPPPQTNLMPPGAPGRPGRWQRSARRRREIRRQLFPDRPRSTRARRLPVHLNDYVIGPDSNKYI